MPGPISEKTHYEVLGVAQTASLQEIKRAHKKLALIFHPDRNSNLDEEGKEERQKKFHEMQKAYDVLSDEEKRKRYDQSLQLGVSHSPVTIKQKGMDQGIVLEAKVPLEEIENEFWKFVEEKVGKKGITGEPVRDDALALRSNTPLYTKSDFKAETMEGPPKMLILTFPDVESAKEFMQHLINNNMATLPKGNHLPSSEKPSIEASRAKADLRAMREEQAPTMGEEQVHETSRAMKRSM